MMSGSSLYRSYKLSTVYVAPVLSATIIFLDWFHTYQWKKQGRPMHPVVRAIWERLQFDTLSNRFFGDISMNGSPEPLLLILVSLCWDRAAYEKVQLMKGKSLMYKDKIAAIPPGQDVWRW
uniref:Cas1_AcylT domain-containing protein n=1 Tax=Syphacia muris TaxID=451379 RepID=A0A0N5AVZ9_9BILA